MIKFFRKIRYDLMTRNKTSRYFKYTIGKIVFVVIGILIAENLASPDSYRDLKGGLSKDIIHNLSVDIPSGIEGERKGKTIN